MSKALIIKGANYASNALDVVQIEGSGSVPCTGLTLSDNALSINYGATRTLTATATPSDTTDLMLWSSSNSSVVSVTGGVLTATGLGTATITVTCGSYSATCTVTVGYELTDTLNVAGKRLAGAPISTGNGTVYTDAGTQYGAICASSGNLPLYNKDSKYPISIPNGATKVRITVPSGVSIYRIAMIDATQSPPTASGNCTLLAFVSGSDMTVVSSGVYEYTLQTYDGYVLDAIAFSFQKTSFADTDFDGITVEFLAA